MAEIAARIDRWLREIVLGNDLDRANIAQIDEKSGELILRHTSSSDGLARLSIGLQIPVPRPWSDQVMLKGRTFAYSRVKELPAEFHRPDWKKFRRFLPKSEVLVPLRIAGEIAGLMGFATLKKERTWSPLSIRRLESVAAIFGSAFERKRTAEENALLRHELSHISRAAVMGQLSASITHQLNQPIAAILSNAEAIQSILQSDQPDLTHLREAAADIVHDDLRASEIIRGLRDFFRNDQVKKVPLDLADVVGEVIGMVGSDALLRDVSLIFEAPSWLPRVLGDRIHLQQVIFNLILNAFDAVSQSDARQVSVGISQIQEHVVVSVRDTGRGIDPAAASQIFEPFFTTKSGGMGMGLAIARSIVKAHDGELSARRNSDGGSTFEVLLPMLNAT